MMGINGMGHPRYAPIDLVHDSISWVSLPLYLRSTFADRDHPGIGVPTDAGVFPLHRAGGALSALVNFKILPFQTGRPPHAQPISGRNRWYRPPVRTVSVGLMVRVPFYDTSGATGTLSRPKQLILPLPVDTPTSPKGTMRGDS